jgi:hypothetical protein
VIRRFPGIQVNATQLTAAVEVIDELVTLL